VIDEDECTGCMLCYWYAPPGMVSMEVQK
jgi:NAD-dependent dihydropyrimidine dehydrogenase PreA subunit